MNKLYFYIFFIVLISCKKDPILDSVTDSKSGREGKIIVVDTILLSPFRSKSLMAFYNSKGNKTVWQLEKNRKSILEHLKKCEVQGLNPLDYNSAKLLDLEKKFPELDDNQQVNYDLLLTYNFQKYLTHLHNGKLNPRKLYIDWDLHIKDFDTNAVINECLEKDSFSTEIEKSEPIALTYKKLIKALQLVNEFPKDSVPPIVSEDKINHNESNNAIINIKKRLRYWKDLATKDTLTSFYDDKTFEAVKKFQTRHGLLSDGIIGKGTIAALNFTKEQRTHQIIVNLERWRWFSKSFTENYLLVNIANYSLTVIEDQKITMTKKIVVGKIKRKTPILTSTLKTVVFNPTWTVPPTILKEDIVPEMIKDRNHLKKKNISIYDNKNNEVDPLNWNEKKPNGYRYVQKPGYYNSLGVIKITFPNTHSVYLHDTNHRNLFDRNNRSLSSGCVRIEKPLELAQLLLNDPKRFSKEKIDSIVATKKTVFLKIKKQYSIYQWYWTAWSENNELVFRDDIYKLDSDLYAKLRN